MDLSNLFNQANHTYGHYLDGNTEVLVKRGPNVYRISLIEFASAIEKLLKKA